MSNEKRKFEPGNRVSLKALPNSMLIVSPCDFDENGYGGEYYRCIWFDNDRRLQSAYLRADWLELDCL